MRVPERPVDIDRWLDRNREIEPPRQRAPRRHAEQLRLRALMIGFQSATAQPHDADRCYACGNRAVAYKDRRDVGGQVERACVVHADQDLPTRAVRR